LNFTSENKSRFILDFQGTPRTPKPTRENLFYARGPKPTRENLFYARGRDHSWNFIGIFSFLSVEPSLTRAGASIVGT
jgi:hypothetical protein